jgi:GT2 family glycosyltransferase
MMIGFVILNYCTFNDTVTCIESIQANTENHHIVVVDNQSPDGSYAALAEIYRDDERIVIIQAPSNRGYASGNNIGIRKCVELGIEHIIVTNSDVVFLGDAAEVLVECLTEHNAVIAGPQILDENGAKDWLPNTKRKGYLQYLGWRRSQNTLLDADYSGADCEVKLVSGCCFAINASRFREMGAFDENTFLYHEEEILSVQAERCNYPIFFCPSAVVQHFHGKSTGRFHLRIDIEDLKSALYYWVAYQDISRSQVLLIKLVKLTKITAKLLVGRIRHDGLRSIAAAYRGIWAYSFKNIQSMHVAKN